MGRWAPVLVSILAAILTLATWELLRGDGEGTGQGGESESGLVVSEVRGLDERLTALEAKDAPTLVGTGVEAQVLEKLHDLERRLSRLEASPTTHSFTPSAPSDPGAPTESIAAATTATEEPALQDLERFRMLRRAAQREDKKKRAAARIDKALADADLTLTKRQRELLAEAEASFQGRRDELWSEAKSSAMAQGGDVDWGEVIATTSAVIQREFAERLAEFLPWQDAEAVSGTLYRAGSKR